MLLDFDCIDEWAPALASVLAPLLGGVEAELSRIKSRYVGDSLAMLLAYGRREPVIHETLRWIRSSGVYAFHGSRLVSDEVDSVRASGLRPLAASQRSVRLTRVLSSHPNWPSVAPQLNQALQQFGPGMRSGGREGQVHLTLSRAGLTNGFNHYLKHGAEFDQHVAEHLLGQDGLALLAADGQPLIVRVAVPGQKALEGAHVYFSVEEVLAQGEIPNLVREFLSVWSYRLAHPGYQSSTLRVDSGIRFDEIVPADWIVSVETP
jgi:hypothetical protein